MKYAFFAGCTTLARLEGYELSTRKVAETIGLELLDMPGSSCCGTTYLEAFDRKASMILAARNICIAEEMGYNIITICNGCTEVLTKANNVLKSDPKLRNEVNEELSKIGREFKGSVEVKHFVRALKEDVGLERIKVEIKRPFHGLKVGAHYGCHLLKPSDIMRFEDPESPKILDELVEVTGADSIPYLGKLECCGGPVMGVREKVTWNIGLEKVETLKKCADAMITVCPFCYLTYERCQLISEVQPNLPIVHYPQLLGLALGLGYEELGIDKNKIDSSNLMKFLEA